MPVGQVHKVLVCTPTTGASDSVCGVIDGVSHVQTVQTALLVDPAFQDLFQSLAEPFSPVFAGGVFAFFFSSTLAIWVVAKSAGAIVAAVRKF